MVPTDVGWGYRHATRAGQPPAPRTSPTPITSHPPILAAPPSPWWGQFFAVVRTFALPQSRPPSRSMGRTRQQGRGNRGTAAHLPVHRPSAPDRLVAPASAAAARGLLPALRAK